MRPQLPLDAKLPAHHHVVHLRLPGLLLGMRRQGLQPQRHPQGHLPARTVLHPIADRVHLQRERHGLPSDRDGEPGVWELADGHSRGDIDIDGDSDSHC